MDIDQVAILERAIERGVEARSAAAAAHHRLDAVNGHIDGFRAEMHGFRDELTGVRLEMRTLAVRLALVVGAASLVATGIVSLVVLLVVDRTG